jgi:ascorbate-specific PTS system EIIC-type component UlaA
MKLTWNLTNVYEFFGGFAETITIVALICGIVLAFLTHLTAEYAAMVTAVGGSAIAHDQLTQWNNRKDHNGDDHHDDQH